MKRLQCLKELSSDDKVKILAVLSAFLGGIILGFWFSPIKKGIYFGNNNGNNNGNNSGNGEKEFLEECCCENED